MQAPLTRESAIQEGLATSPVIEKSVQTEQEADWGEVLGLSGLVPHVDLLANHYFDTEYRTVPVTLGSVTAAVPTVYPKTSYGVEARWTVFDGLANVRTYQSSRDLKSSARQERARKELELTKKIELAFYNALAAQRFAEVAAENVKTLEEGYARIANRLKGGVATQYDVLRVEVQLSDARTELERATDNVEIQRRSLTQVMGKPEDDRPITGELPVPTEIERVKALSPPELQSRGDFEAARLKSEAAQHAASAAEGRLLPSVALAAQYERYENTGYPGEAYGGFRNAWNMGVFIRWSILDGGATLAKTGMARAVAAQADRSYSEAVLSLPKDFELWKRRYLYSAHRYEAKLQDRKRSEESYRIANVSFQQGRKTITEVLEAETDLFRARAGVVQAQLDAEEARVQLELTLGKEFK